MDKTVATIEIKNTSLKLLIGYLYDNKINVLYKNEYPLSVTNRDGDIFDVDSLTHDLRKIKTISDPKKRLRIDINEVVLILEPFGLEVFESSRTTTTVSSDSRVTKLDIANVHSMFKKVQLPTDNTEIVDIVPFAFSLDNQRIYDTPPLEEKSSSIMVNAHIYTLPSKIVNSLKKAVTDSGLVCKRVVIAPLGVNSLLKLNKFEEAHYLLIDYNKDNTIVSFFGDNKLYGSKFFSHGSNEITKAIANNFEISMDKAEELKINYGYDLRETQFNPPILSVVGEDQVSRKHDVKELREVINKTLVEWNILFSNCIKTLLQDYGDLKETIPFVFVGNGCLLNGFEEFIKDSYPSNRVKIWYNDSIGATSPGDMNALGAISFVSTYKGSLEDDSKIEISKVSRRKEVKEYIEEEDEL